MAPLTSICAPSRTSVRLPALTPTCPPVASVSESPWKSTVPPLSTCTSDRSRRYGSVCPSVWPVARLAGIRASRCPSSAVAPSRSTRMAVVEPERSVTAPSAPTPFRWMVPRASTEVVEASTPACSTWRAASVMSPSGDRIRPLLRTVPTPEAVTSLPRVVEATLPSVPWPRLITKLSPAASAAWPWAW